MEKWIYAAVVGFLSLIAFFVYAADKRRAKKRLWRVPEKALLGLSFFGGAPGGYAAMWIFRHKTKKWYFHLVNLSGLAWQAAAFVLLMLK